MLHLANSLIFKLANGLVINTLRFVILVIAARLMTKEQFGLYTFVFSIAFLVVALVNLGLPTTTAQHMSAAIFRENNKAKATGTLILAAKFRLLATVTTAIILVVIILSNSVDTLIGGTSIWLLAVVVFLFKSLDVWFEYVFASLQEYKSLFLGMTLPRESLRIILVGGLIVWGFSGMKLIAIDGIVLLLSTIMATIILAYQFRNTSIQKNDWKPFIIFALSIAPTSLIALSYERINIIILGKYVSMSQIAEYNAAYQFTALAILLIPIGSVVVLPTFMSLNRQQLDKFVNTIIRITLVIMLPIFFSLQLFGDEVLILLYGEKYMASGIILSVFAFLLIERIVSPTLQNVLLSRNRPKVITVAMAVGGGINILLAITLVQILGAIGAAIALIIARYLVMAILFGVLVADKSHFQFKKYAMIIMVSTLSLGWGLWLEDISIKVTIFFVGILLYGYIMVKYLIVDDANRVLILLREHRGDWQSLINPR